MVEYSLRNDDLRKTWKGRALEQHFHLLVFICSDICMQFPAFTINWWACAWKALSWWSLCSCLWLLKTTQCHQWMFSTEQNEVVESRVQILNCRKERGKQWKLTNIILMMWLELFTSSFISPSTCSLLLSRAMEWLLRNYTIFWGKKKLSQLTA